MENEKRLIFDSDARRRIIAFATGLHSEVLPVDTVMMLLAQAPTVDAVEVVRCRECKYYVIVDEFEDCKRYMCLVNHFSYLDNDGDNHFCSYGERRTDVKG